jgi:hypothetical protein
MAEQVFDPLARGWEILEDENLGLTMLQEKEAVVAVLEPDVDLAASVAANYDELEPNDLKCMVLADMFPVSSLAHVLVVGRRATTYETATDVERAMVGDIAHAVVGRMRETMDPCVGFGVAYFGGIPTFHANVTARDKQAHAVRWAQGDRTKKDLDERRALVDTLDLGDPLEVPLLQAVHTKTLRRYIEPS